ncbi:pseudouridine synthase [Salipaludibacillus neizhouensis]|uniref:pseudouridine synthase n=1 Tax=Salipaludibacillus neizhouensis TaxID=885475 RepID=UPI001602B0ED|nr:pseudouridine synthase [Salipaludibacillus neizhouensis]
MRTDKLLATMGFGSRKDVKKILKQGLFSVNGEIVKDGKRHVNTVTDILKYSGEVIEYRETIYIMLNKPKGYVSATEDKTEKTVIDILQPEDALFDPFPVGRLDKDTTGLLLLTNDGKLAHQLLSPKKKVDKRYIVHLDLPINEEDILALEQGVTLDDGYTTKPAKVEYKAESNASVAYITIQEGKYHQVKRMFQTRGKKVIELKRERMGSLVLDNELELGEYRELTPDELEELRSHQGHES